MPGYQKKPKEPYDQKTAILTPEEQEMRKENLEAREHWHTDTAKSLCAAICLATIKDYRKNVRLLRLYNYRRKADFRMTRREKDKLNKQIEDIQGYIEECEDFFDSDMFVICTGVNNKDEAIQKIMAIPDGYDHLLEGSLIG